jgi:hypothetical protein
MASDQESGFPPNGTGLPFATSNIQRAILQLLDFEAFQVQVRVGKRIAPVSAHQTQRDGLRDILFQRYAPRDREIRGNGR